MWRLHLRASSVAVWGSIAALLANIEPTSAVQLAYTACNQWGECWEQPDYRSGDGYEDYWHPRQELYPQRPPTKWERKGFCPPGQHKKGNC